MSALAKRVGFGAFISMRADKAGLAGVEVAFTGLASDGNGAARAGSPVKALTD